MSRLLTARAAIRENQRRNLSSNPLPPGISSMSSGLGNNDGIEKSEAKPLEGALAKERVSDSPESVEPDMVGSPIPNLVSPVPGLSRRRRGEEFASRYYEAMEWNSYTYPGADGSSDSGRAYSLPDVVNTTSTGFPYMSPAVFSVPGRCALFYGELYNGSPRPGSYEPSFNTWTRMSESQEQDLLLNGNGREQSSCNGSARYYDEGFGYFSRDFSADTGHHVDDEHEMGSSGSRSPLAHRRDGSPIYEVPGAGHGRNENSAPFDRYDVGNSGHGSNADGYGETGNNYPRFEGRNDLLGNENGGHGGEETEQQKFWAEFYENESDNDNDSNEDKQPNGGKENNELYSDRDGDIMTNKDGGGNVEEEELAKEEEEM